jgi:phosphohistidine phosphatase
MRLYLVRHGQAVTEDVDPQRPLSENGVADTHKIAQFLKKAHVQIDSFYHSTKKRAEQTAEIIRDILNPKASLQIRVDLSPNDSIEGIVKEISGWNNNILVVGHLPFLSYLVSHLTVGNDSEAIVAIPAGSVVILEHDSSRSWYIAALITPEFL